MLPGRFPLVCLPPSHPGTENDLNKGINFESGRFDELLGEGARVEVMDMICERFNMDGKDPSGRKVGLLDRHHLMAFLVDPFAHAWRGKFELQTCKAELVAEMIALYVPLDEDGSSKSRREMRKEFQVSVLLFFQLMRMSTSLNRLNPPQGGSHAAGKMAECF